MYGNTERLVVLENGQKVYPDGYTSAYGAVADAKYVSPTSTSSFYRPDSMGSAGMRELAIADMDATLLKLRSASMVTGGHGVVEIAANNLDAAHFIEARMSALDITGYVRIVEP